MAEFNVTDFIKRSFGDTQIFGDLTTTGSITASGDVTAFSDSRLKKNIMDMGNTLPQVVKLRGVHYQDIDSEKQKLGMIAQELEEVYPELVVDVDGYKTINYSLFSVVLLEAIKEQQKQIEKLKEQI